MRRRLFAAAVAAGIGSVLAPAMTLSGAIPPPKDIEFQGTFAQAAREARDKFRLLVIYEEGHDPNDAVEFRRRTLGNHTLAAYFKWHCVVYKVPPTPSAITHLRKMGIRDDGPGIAVYRFVVGDRLEQLFGWKVGPALSNLNPMNMPGGEPLQNFERPRFIPTPLLILGQVDRKMEGLRARDPIWMAMHERHNPPPAPPPAPPPEPEPLCLKDDAYGPAVRDPTGNDREDTGPLDRLARARAMMREGNLHEATGLLTWLWERSEKSDPAFRSARLSVVAEQLRRLAELRPDVGKRLDELKDRQERRVLWADYEQFHEYFVSCAFAGKDEDVIVYLDQFVNDPDEGAMLPETDRIAYSLLAHREGYAKATELPADPVAHVARIVRALSKGRPASASERDGVLLERFLRSYVVDEGARIYAALLAKGRDDEAVHVGEMVLKAQDTALARRALVTTALSQMQPQARAHQINWLGDAVAQSDERSAMLKERVRGELGGSATR